MRALIPSESITKYKTLRYRKDIKIVALCEEKRNKTSPLSVLYSKQSSSKGPLRRIYHDMHNQHYPQDEEYRQFLLYQQQQQQQGVYLSSVQWRWTFSQFNSTVGSVFWVLACRSAAKSGRSLSKSRPIFSTSVRYGKVGPSFWPMLRRLAATQGYPHPAGYGGVFCFLSTDVAGLTDCYTAGYYQYGTGIYFVIILKSHILTMIFRLCPRDVGNGIHWGIRLAISAMGSNQSIRFSAGSFFGWFRATRIYCTPIHSTVDYRHIFVDNPAFGIWR